jgi:SAM-dependent methyltransferase
VPGRSERGPDRDGTPRGPAEIYDEFFVPALFRPWADVVARAANVGPRQRVLDVGCGTGVLACVAAAQVGPEGAVVGLDPSDEMLAVARRKSAAVDWHTGRAEAIPFADGSFDAVVSQFALMFFDDRVAALREMMRVLRPGGRMAVAVCDSLEHSVGYATLAGLLERLFGTGVADAFRAPFALGAPERLSALCADAGIAAARVTRHEGAVRFASIASLIATERACAWTLGGLLDDEQFARLATEAQAALRPFVDAGGLVVFAMPALIVTGSAGDRADPAR